MPDTAAAVESWRDWTEQDQKKQPRRTCSVAGCKDAPSRVKTTRTSKGKTAVERRHVYCPLHAPVDA